MLLGNFLFSSTSRAPDLSFYVSRKKMRFSFWEKNWLYYFYVPCSCFRHSKIQMLPWKHSINSPNILVSKRLFSFFNKSGAVFALEQSICNGLWSLTLISLDEWSWKECNSVLMVESNDKINFLNLRPSTKFMKVRKPLLGPFTALAQIWKCRCSSYFHLIEISEKLGTRFQART